MIKEPTTRRKFMSWLGVAPAAVPVAAKQAAQAMGLAEPANIAVMTQDYAVSGTVTTGSADWVREALQEFKSPWRKAEFMRQAKEVGRRLDPDLAAMRSVSPAWAYGKQVQRTVKRIEAQERGWLERQLNNEW